MRNNVVLFKEACSALEAKAFLWLRVNVNKIMLLSVFTESSWLWTFASALFHSPSDSSRISSSVPPTSDFSFMTGQIRSCRLGALLCSQADTAGRWAAHHTWGTPHFVLGFPPVRRTQRSKKPGRQTGFSWKLREVKIAAATTSSVNVNRTILLSLTFLCLMENGHPDRSWQWSQRRK